MPERLLSTKPFEPNQGAVLAVNARLTPEGDRWSVYLDVISMPDRDDYITTHRMGDYASRNRATLAAMWMLRRAEQRMRINEEQE